MKARGVFDITEFTNRSGSTSYRVTGTKHNGDRVRKNFCSSAEASGEKQRLEIEAANLPPAAGLVRTNLTPEQCAEAERAFTSLGDRSMTLAVKFFIENYRDSSRSKPLRQAFDEFISAKQASNRRPATVINLKSRVGYLVRMHEGKCVHEILPHHIAACVHRGALKTANSRDNERRALSSFFGWARKQGYCGTSPVHAVDVVKAERDTPEILTLPEVRRIMACASAFSDGELVPYFALAIFAAIRPAELARMTWDDIDLKAKIAVVQGKAAKLRQRRTVKLSNNGVAWLKPYAARRVPIVGPGWRNGFEAVQRLAGFGDPNENQKLKPWPHDVLRHTGISYHFAFHEHEGQTASWAGNSPDIVHKHYKALVKPKDAASFWKISPDKRKRKIVKLDLAA